MRHAGIYELQREKFTISVISVMEVVKGHQKVKREAEIQAFINQLNNIEVLVLDSEASIVAGRIFAKLEGVEKPIGYADCMIAALAITHQLVLVIGNTAHYQRIQTLGYPLTLANWRL